MGSHHIYCRQAFEFFRFVCQIDCISVCVFLFWSGKEQTESLRPRVCEKWADRSNEESRSDSHRYVTLRRYLTCTVQLKRFDEADVLQFDGLLSGFFKEVDGSMRIDHM